MCIERPCRACRVSRLILTTKPGRKSANITPAPTINANIVRVLQKPLGITSRIFSTNLLASEWNCVLRISMAFRRARGLIGEDFTTDRLEAPADHAQLGVGAKKLSLTRVARSERQGVAAGDLRRRARVIDRYRTVVCGSGGLQRLDQLRRAADVAELARSFGEAIAHRRLRIVVGEGDRLHERQHRPRRT